MVRTPAHHPTPGRARPLALLLAALVLPASAQAQSTSVGGAADAAADAVIGCLDIRDSGARLACFDRTVRALRDAPAAAPAVSQAPPVPAAPSAGPSAAAPTAPGLAATTPAAPAPAAPPEPPGGSFGAERLPEVKAAREKEEAEEILTAKLVSIRELVPNRSLLTLDNGQLWFQKDAVRFRGKPGDPITIRRGLFGSYDLRVEGVKAPYKVERVQ